MKNILCIAVMLVGGLFISQTASAQQVRMGNADFCSAVVTLNWGGACASSSTYAIPALSILTVPAPCTGSPLISADVTYNGQSTVPIFAPICGLTNTTPAVTCGGSPTSIDLSNAVCRNGNYYLDINP